MKISILSMQRIMNYGSLLQAYSLMKMLQEMGHSVEFIDIEPNEEDNRLQTRTEHFDEGMDLTSRTVLYRFMQQDTNPFLALNKIKAKKGVLKKQQLFADHELKLNEENNKKHYDACVIGSDEVFNCLSEAPWGFTGQLFGKVPQADKVITYAASCGFTKAEEVPPAMGKTIQSAFENVSAFSVRDENTACFVRSYTDKPIAYHLDPVVVGDFTKEMEKCTDVCLKKLPRRYCIVYAYHGRISNPDEIKAILKLCKEQDMVPVSIGGYQKWVHRHLELDPFEVLAAFQNAQFVVTDTFHGTVFSAKYAERFAVIVRKSNANKLGDLVSRLGIEQHQISQIKDLPEIYSRRAQKAHIDDLIKKERNKTIQYLENNL